MSASILTQELTKFYGKEKTPALHKLNLQVRSGEIYGYLGSNGAGKSTTIRLLLNFLQPSSGTIKILDYDGAKDAVAVKKHVGYLSGDVALYQKATGRQFLDYMSSLQPATAYRKELEKRFEADLHKPINTLSKGNRQKLGIIQAFMHEPAVLILDEPSSGLDPLMQEAFYQTLKEAKQRGGAVLMSSHNLDEAQRVCDRIGIIKKGVLIHEQAISGDTQLTSPVFQVTFGDHHELELCLRSAHLKHVGTINSLTASFQPKDSIKAALKEFSQYDIHSFETQTLNLEDEFLDFYGSKK
jgi:ABC-2 type transport system ATP-binding protein